MRHDGQPEWDRKRTLAIKKYPGWQILLHGRLLSSILGKLSPTQLEDVIIQRKNWIEYLVNVL